MLSLPESGEEVLKGKDGEAYAFGFVYKDLNSYLAQASKALMIWTEEQCDLTSLFKRLS